MNIIFLGKNHVCRFVGCGRNDRFNYVVMELQVISISTSHAYNVAAPLHTCDKHHSFAALRGGIWQTCAEL